MGLAAGALSPGKLKHWKDKMDGDVENYVDIYIYTQCDLMLSVM